MNQGVKTNITGTVKKKYLVNKVQMRVNVEDFMNGVEISVKVYHCFSAKGTSVFDDVMAV